MAKLDVGVPSERPHLGMKPGVGVTVRSGPNIMEDIMPLFQSRKPKKALADGTYMRGSSKFKIRKGSPIPEGVEVTYTESYEQPTTASDVFAAKIAAKEQVSKPAKKETAKS